MYSSGWIKCCLVVLLAACATSELGPSAVVKAETAEGADLSGFGTYAWAPGALEKETRFAMDDTIRAAIETELADRGYALAATGADFIVDYHIGTESETAAVGGRPDRSGMGRSRSFTIQRGTLAVQVTEPGAPKVVWWGSASDVIQFRITDEKAQARVSEAVQRIIAKFPKAKSNTPD